MEEGKVTVAELVRVVDNNSTRPQELMFREAKVDNLEDLNNLRPKLVERSSKLGCTNNSSTANTPSSVVSLTFGRVHPLDLSNTQQHWPKMCVLSIERNAQGLREIDNRFGLLLPMPAAA